MVIEYLEKMHREMYEQKLSLECEYKNNELLLKENIRFIYTLENSLDKNYESFSPRNVNHESYEKIESLKKERNSIEEKSEELKLKINNLDEHLVEIENVLRIVRKNTKEATDKEILIEEDEIFRKKILETQEMERQRIARELHDSIVQSLTAMVHKIEFCTKLADMDTVRCKLELQAMSKTVKKIIEDMRQVIYNLRPMSLDDIGLDVTLEREVTKLQNSEKIFVEYQTEGVMEKLSPLVSLTILRIVQEACNNVIKHANANKIKILISYEKSKVNVIIQDDGCGFDIENVQYIERSDGSGFGISMMKERVYLLSGKIDIKSIIGEGTIIKVEIPTEEEKE